MMRKLLLALATGAALALAALPTTASARVGGFGGHGGMGHVGMGHVGMGHVGFGRPAFVHGGFHRFGVRHFAFHRGFRHFRHFRHGRFFVAGIYPYGTCWRWVPGPYGWHRVWVCNYGYGWY